MKCELCDRRADCWAFDGYYCSTHAYEIHDIEHIMEDKK